MGRAFQMGRHTRFWLLWLQQAGPVQMNLHILVFSLEPSLLAYTKYRSGGRFRPEDRPVSLLDTSVRGFNPLYTNGFFLVV